MKKFYDYFVTLMLAVTMLCSFNSCEQDPVDPNDGDDDNTEEPAAAPTISAVAEVDFYGTATVTVSVADATKYAYLYCAADTEVDLEDITAIADWSAEDVTEDGDYTVVIEDAEVGKYKFYAVAFNGIVMSEVASTEYEITEPVAFICEVEASSLIATATFKINTDLCDGMYILEAQYAEYFDPNFSSLVSDVESGQAGQFGGKLITKDTTFVISGANYLNPGVKYISEAVTFTETDGVIKADPLQLIEFYTEDPVCGKSDATIEFELGETTITSITATVYNNEDVSGYYSGCVAKADAPDGVDAYLTSSNWFAPDQYNFANMLSQTDYWSGETTVFDEKECQFPMLADGTEYYIFAIPIDNAGWLGAVNTIETSTTTIATDATIIPEIEVTPLNTSIVVKYTFGDCAKIFGKSGDADSEWATAEQAYTDFLNDQSEMMYGWNASDYPEGFVIDTMNYLEMGKAYNIYYMGIKADGTMGEVQTYETATTEPSYDSAAAVTLEIDYDNSTYSWLYNPEDESMADWNKTQAKLTINVTMSPECVKYMYAVIENSYVMNPIPSQYGNYIVKNSYYQKFSSEAVLEGVEFSSKKGVEASTGLITGSILVVIPIDADGAYGTPVTIQGEWEDDKAVWVDPNASSGDGTGDDSGMVK